MARILALTNMYPPHHLGGYELECRDILERFRARGHACTLLTTTMRVAGVADPPGEHALGTRRELGFYWRDHEIVKPPLLERWRMERANQALLRRALDEVRPDVISVWHMGAMSLGLLTTLHQTGIPIVYVVCDDWLTYARRQDAWMQLFRRVPAPAASVLSRMVGTPCALPDLGRSGTFCFVSGVTRRVAERESSWTYPDATVVYSGIDPTDFPLRPDARPGWSWRLLYVGRVDPRKGIATAIRALAQLPAEATLDVVGRGDEEHLADLHRLADELGVADRIRWMVAERDELASVYRSADVFVFPVTWDEPFGLVPLEAMACGTPVVATGTGGSGEFLVDGWNCLRFRPGDAVSLAGAVGRLADDPGLRTAVVRAGGLTAAELTIDRLADVLEAWHTGAATGFREGRPPERTTIQAVLGAVGSG